MGTPIIAGATIWKARVLVSDGGAGVEWVPLLAGLPGATLAGLLAIRFLLGYLRRHTTGIFIAWRLVLAGLVVVLAPGAVRPPARPPPGAVPWRPS